jgi:hypothetical protein
MKTVSAPGARTIDCLPVLIKTGSITAYKCIPKLARSRYPSVYPNLLDHSLHVYLSTRPITASMCMSKVARSGPAIAFPNSDDLGLHVHLESLWIRAFKVHLQNRSITTSKVDPQSRSTTTPPCVPAFTQSSFSGAPSIALQHRLQPVQIYRV